MGRKVPIRFIRTTGCKDLIARTTGSLTLLFYTKRVAVAESRFNILNPSSTPAHGITLGFGAILLIPSLTVPFSVFKRIRGAGRVLQEND